jgi:hypothetical protein
MIKFNKTVLMDLSLDDKEIDENLTNNVAGGSETWFCSVWACATTGCECPNPEVL